MTGDYRQRKEFQDYTRETQLRVRIRLLRALLALLFVVYLGSYWYNQVVRADHYRTLSDSNRIRNLPLTPLRGIIVDREGRVLAKNRSSFTVVVDRVDEERWDRTRGHLAELLQMDPMVLEERRRRTGGQIGPEGIVIQEDVDLAQAAYIESHLEEFPSVRVRVEPRRFYEGGRWAPHILGYVGEVSKAQMGSDEFAGVRAGEIVGKAGLERRLNASLQGRQGTRRVVVNALGREIDTVGGEAPEPGSRLVLTLDLDLQRALAVGFGEHRGSAVVLDPWSGEILALASFPAFDPNLFAGRFTREDWEKLALDPEHPLQNRVIQSRFSAGSTFKLVIAAAALESGVIDVGTKVFCPGHARIYGRRINCNFRGGHGWVNVHQALVKSCNVFFYLAGKDLGIEAIARQARVMGLGRLTGVDLPHEDAGLVPDVSWSRRVRKTPWYPGETISVSIGQGPLLVTPLQMASLIGAVATGRFATPHLVRSLDGVAVESPPPPAALAVSTDTLDVLRRGLWGVVNEEGTGRRARLPGFPDIQVAGKTGTVQLVRASAGVDSKDLPEEIRDHAWFVGYAPADSPAVAFAIFVEHGGHGGSVAAPIARRVLEVFFGKILPAVEERVARG